MVSGVFGFVYIDKLYKKSHPFRWLQGWAGVVLCFLWLWQYNDHEYNNHKIGN
jgi:hypothetical protein